MHKNCVQNLFQKQKSIFGRLYYLAKKLGFGFKRQRPIDNFIVDFFCSELNLIIEIDGNSHYRKPAYDFYRQEKLKWLGYHILRFTEGEVIQNIGSVYERIVYSIECLKTDQNKN